MENGGRLRMVDPVEREEVGREPHQWKKPPLLHSIVRELDLIGAEDLRFRITTTLKNEVLHSQVEPISKHSAASYFIDVFGSERKERAYDEEVTRLMHLLNI